MLDLTTGKDLTAASKDIKRKLLYIYVVNSEIFVI
jgi:hypothetical protein